MMLFTGNREQGHRAQTGARGLRSIIDVMFEVPSKENVKLVRITKEAVDGTDKPILETA